MLNKMLLVLADVLTIQACGFVVITSTYLDPEYNADFPEIIAAPKYPLAPPIIRVLPNDFL